MPHLRHTICLALAASLMGGAGLSSGQEPPAAPVENPPKTGSSPPGPLPPAPPSQTTVFARNAMEAMRLKQWKEARESWYQVLKLDPQNAPALANLGKVLMQLGEDAEARTVLEKVVALRPNFSQSWVALGLLHQRMKSPMLAISALARAIHEDQSDYQAHNALAVVLKQQGWNDGALEELRKALDINPQYAEAHFNLALLYLEQKPPAVEMASRHYEAAKSLGAVPDELVDKQIKEAREAAAAETPKTAQPVETTRNAPGKTPEKKPEKETKPTPKKKP